jgi:hypothetical protein
MDEPAFFFRPGVAPWGQAAKLAGLGAALGAGNREAAEFCRDRQARRLGVWTSGAVGIAALGMISRLRALASLARRGAAAGAGGIENALLALGLMPRAGGESLLAAVLRLAGGVARIKRAGADGHDSSFAGVA